MPRLTEGRMTQDPSIWWQTTLAVLESLFNDCTAHHVKAISVDATSGTVLVTNAYGKPLAPGLMYNDASCVAQAKLIRELAPPDNTANNASSGLAKLLYLHRKLNNEVVFSLNQADWISGNLAGAYGYSDRNNSLKMGYDVIHQKWPRWIKDLSPSLYQTLPSVVEPGRHVGNLSIGLTKKFKIASGVNIVAGTTDSIAALIASGASAVGQAVSSLGSTLVLKLISTKPLYDAEYGIYSHRLGQNWLVGGASNSGGAVLSHYFSPDEIKLFSKQLKPNEPQPHAYYPLINPGERFPLNDPLKESGIPERPKKDLAFFQALVEGIARIEKQGYEKLAELGMPYPSVVYSAGGGAINEKWTSIRQNMLGIPVTRAKNEDAAYGVAMLALQSTKIEPKFRS